MAILYNSIYDTMSTSIYGSVPQQPDSTVCVICSKVCRSASGLKRHMVVHKDSICHADPINPVMT